MDVRARVWDAYRTPRQYVGPEVPERGIAMFGSVVACDLGVTYPWGKQLCAGGAVPPAEDVAAAAAWLESRGPSTWRARVPQALVGEGPWAGLTAYDRIGVFAMPVQQVAGIEAVEIPGLRLSAEPTFDDVITAYGGWMGDDELARQLVLPVEIDLDYRRFIVGYVDDRPIGCAFVWFIDGTAYLSGIGVIEELRGRGYGTALTVAATLLAAEPPAGTGVDLLWMGATTAGAPVYAKLGYELIDTEVQLGPAV